MKRMEIPITVVLLFSDDPTEDEKMEALLQLEMGINKMMGFQIPREIGKAIMVGVRTHISPVPLSDEDTEPGCCNGCSRKTSGELRWMPTEDGNTILICRHCFDLAMTWRATVTQNGNDQYPILRWWTLELYLR